MWSQVMKYCTSLGFSKAQVEACIDKMWADGSDDYEDKNAVAEVLLAQNKKEASEEEKEEVPDQTESQAQEEPTESEELSHQEAGEAPEEDAGASKEETEAQEEEEQPAPVQPKLTMAKKLEIVRPSVAQT